MNFTTKDRPFLFAKIPLDGPHEIRLQSLADFVRDPHKIVREETVLLAGDQITCTATEAVWKPFFDVNVKMNISPGRNHFLIEGDTWGRAPLFYSLHDETVILSSHLALLIKVIGQDAPMPRLAQNLAAHGFLRGDETPVENVFKLPADKGLRISRENGVESVDRRYLPSRWFCDDLDDEWLAEAVEILEDAVARIVSMGVRCAAVSGGTDSRLTLALVPREVRGEMLAYTKAANMDAHLDNDVVLASEVTRHLGIRHKILRNPRRYNSYLWPEFTEEVNLSGLYGGEFLGGVFPRMLPWEVDLEDEASLRELFLATIGSSRGLFYGGASIGWGCPYTQNYFTSSPFLDARFLNHIVRLKFREFADYRAYDKIWSLPRFRELAKIPFQSPLTNWFTYPVREVGSDPKQSDRAAEPALTPTEFAERNAALLRYELSRDLTTLGFI